MNLSTYRCFGEVPGHGSSALVVQDSTLPSEARLDWAHAQPINACVFADVAQDGELSLDFYYPHSRSPLCIHATLAVARDYFTRNQGCDTLQVRTKMHNQKISLRKVGQLYFADLTGGERYVQPAKLDTLPALLGINSSDIQSPPVISSIGSPKLLVDVGSEQVLRTINPDLSGIHNWSKTSKVNGIFAYCHIHGNVYMGRNFNHLAPSLEDPATGVAAGALANYLQQDIKVRQGSFLGNPCEITAIFDGERISIGGQVELRT
jgi:PhzF family phenazine biosynthesis protein